MSSTVAVPVIVYPDSDGKPMAENTLQYEWIVTIKGNLDILFRDAADVFVAGDNLIYPVQGSVEICYAPDVYVAFGRAKGRRGSYKVWDEGNVFPQVIFEILSPSNRPAEMARKLLFYEQYGAEEYYIYDPDRVRLTAYRRAADGGFEQVANPSGHVSPRLGVRFDMSGPELVIYDPNGQPFLTFLELGERAEQAERRAEQAESEIERLRAALRAAGIDPDALP
jgi:Uma2 family endonuclease